MNPTRQERWDMLQKRILQDSNYRSQIEEKLNARIKSSNTSGCWKWIGEKSTSGYGIIKLQFGVSAYRAHRLMFVITRLQEIPDNNCICHRCDNPGCCNPEHLFLGTKKDNTRDAMAKNRLLGPKQPLVGSRNPSAKLSEEDVRFIRNNFTPKKKYGEFTRDKLSKRFNVNPMTVHRIVTGKGWLSVL